MSRRRGKRSPSRRSARISGATTDHAVVDVPLDVIMDAVDRGMDWLLTVCASCWRDDLPLIVQASGAYCLCVRCETIARAELAGEEG